MGLLGGVWGVLEVLGSFVVKSLRKPVFWWSVVVKIIAKTYVFGSVVVKVIAETCVLLSILVKIIAKQMCFGDKGPC